MIGDKKILDACCGSKMLWFDKNHPSVLFTDIREESHTLCDGRELHIKPDMVIDFRDMPFPDNSFRMVVFDPPHLNQLGKTSWMAKKYGVLLPTWETDIKGGFDECMRVLEPNGFLVFKWNESQITINQVLNLIPYKPLFGHTTGRQAKTIWMVFMKVLNSDQNVQGSDTTDDDSSNAVDNQISTPQSRKHNLNE